MTQEEEMRNEYYALYNLMASSNNVSNMHLFGQVMEEVMEWAIVNKPELARDWLERLEAIRWKNYLTQSEAERIVAEMTPKAPWTREQWRVAMVQHGFEMERKPDFNSCALYTTMNMIMSDSSGTLSRYVNSGNLFKIVHELAIDKLTDADKKFSVRSYFGV